MAKRLKSFRYGGWARGYNNYSGSKSTIDDHEFPPPSVNVIPADRGSVRKAPGAARFGGEVSPGSPVLSGAQYTTASFDYLVVHAGTSTWRRSGSSWVAMTGAVFLADRPVWFCVALGRLYATQAGLSSLYYSTDGSVWNAQSNGKGGITPVFYSSRLYLIADDGNIWYSNAYAVTASPPSYSLGDFGTFNTDLAASPKKNAGFITLFPGAGVTPSALYLDNEVLYAYTERRGYFKITPDGEPLPDGSVSHSIVQANGYFGTRAPRSIAKVGNDQWFDDGQMVNSLGEVALFPTARVTPKYGAVKGDLQNKNPAYPQLPAIGSSDTMVYYAYPAGSFNDRVIAYDLILKAASSPLSGFNCSFFMEYFDGTVKRLLYGSSDPADSYLYEMGSGLTAGNQPVAARFQTKSTDCGLPGLVKRAAKVRVYYTSFLGVLDYEVLLEETRSLTGSQSLGTPSGQAFGLGFGGMGSSPLGRDYRLGTVFALLSSNSFFEIDAEFEAFERIAVEVRNSEALGSFQIDDVEFLYEPGSQFEELDPTT